MAFILSLVSIVASLFIAVIMGTLMGGVVGWTVDLVFPVVNQTLNQLSGLKLDAFDLGAVLGFVGGFIRSSCSQK
jgi:hypothetical protein